MGAYIEVVLAGFVIGAFFKAIFEIMKLDFFLTAAMENDLLNIFIEVFKRCINIKTVTSLPFLLFESLIFTPII